MTSIEKTDLYQELLRRASAIPAGPPDLAGEFERLRTILLDAEKYIVISFPEFTPHDHARHLDGLFALADRVMGSRMYALLGSTELVLLAFGLYSHDWGMAITEAERQFLFDGAPAQGFECLPDEPSASLRFLTEAELTGTPHEVAWRDYIRRTHGFRSGARLRKYLEPIGAVFADAVAKIAEGHTLDIRDVRDADHYPLARSVFGETVNVAALTAYVRIIDLLDIGDDRTPYALWKFVSPLNEFSGLEWQKHTPPYLRDVLGFGEEALTQLGWRPVEVRLVAPAGNETVPLVCRVWRKLVPCDLDVSGEAGRKSFGLGTQGVHPMPQLLRFPAGIDRYAAIGSRYWNVGHAKIAEISLAITKLLNMYGEGRLSAEKCRFISYLTSSSFLGYKVPSRLSGVTLAIDYPNRLLEIAQSEGLAGSLRLGPGDFFPGTVAGYSNPYYYSLREWDARATGLGHPLES